MKSRNLILLITPYLNTRAFIHHGPPLGCKLRAMTPREAQAAIAEGSAVGGVVPVGGLRDLDPLVNYVGAYGIACAGAVDSVLFFSHEPFVKLSADSRIVLTADSMTSVRLLYLLFSYRKCNLGLPRVVPGGEDIDGELAIGDRALRMRRAGKYAHVLDLSAAWYRAHKLPMVFARWVVRKDAPRNFRARVHAWLVAYANDEQSLIRQTARRDAIRAGLDEKSAYDYLRRIRTILQPQDLRGQRTYLRDLARNDYFSFLDDVDEASNATTRVPT